MLLEGRMNIGQAAAASGVSAKMLRYYESIGLIPQAGRSPAGYRIYGDREVETLRFIRRARDFGLPMDRVKLLVGLWQDASRPSRTRGENRRVDGDEGVAGRSCPPLPGG
jgi:MerR family copper efflux transcriptional regulator